MTPVGQFSDHPVIAALEGRHDSAAVAVAGSDEERPANAYPLGRALEQARVRVGFSLETAARSLSIEERELGHYESDIRTPSVHLLFAMGDLYGIDPERLGTRPFLPRVPPKIDHEQQTLMLGWMSIDLRPLLHEPEDRNRYLLKAIGATLRSMRSLNDSQPVYLRRSELTILATILDPFENEFPMLVMRHLGLTVQEAVELTADLRQVS